MPIQPINYAAIPLISSPFKGLDFAELIRQGMQTRHEPQRLLQEREKQELSNALGRENLNQQKIVSQYAPENARNEASIKQSKAQFEPQMLAAGLQKLIQEGKLSSEQAKWFGKTAQSKIDLNSAHAASSGNKQSMPLSTQFDLNTPQGAYYAGKQFENENPNNPEVVNKIKDQIQKHQQQIEDKKLSAQERQMKQLNDAYSEIKNPNTPASRKAELRPFISKTENQLEKIAMGNEVYTRIKKGIEMQDLIKEAITRRVTGYDKKTGKPIYGNAPYQDAVMFSGPIAWTAKAKESKTGSKDFARYKQAQDLLNRINHLYTGFEKLSVQPGAEHERGNILRGESLNLFPKDAGKNLKVYLDRITRGHQKIVDDARKDAGLYVKPIDVNGNWRKDVSTPNYDVPIQNDRPYISKADRFANSQLPPIDYNEYMKGNG